MKILHTADWHIGKSLYKYDLYEDIHLFFKELCSIIQKESVDILLISGDIFDLANPSNRDKELYYQFLGDLMQMKIRVIITAGNHDSVRMLEAPKDLLKYLNIDIVGDARNLDQQIIPIYNDNKELECFVLAVPFLRDRDIRFVQSGEKYKDKVEALRQGIQQHYEKLIQMSKSENDSVPIISMGHLYVQGASISDSEREIQIGNTAGISVNNFQELFDYMALGHIHRPQKLNKSGSIRYSGSPIALSFSERKDEKVIVIVELDSKGIQSIESIKLEKYRDLIRLKGTVEEIRQSLAVFQNTRKLPAFIELHAIEKEKDQTKYLELLTLSNESNESYQIVQHRIQFENQQIASIQKNQQRLIEEMKPIDVFRARISDSIPEEETRKILENLFYELVEDWEQR